MLAPATRHPSPITTTAATPPLHHKQPQPVADTAVAAPPASHTLRSATVDLQEAPLTTHAAAQAAGLLPPEPLLTWDPEVPRRLPTVPAPTTSSTGIPALERMRRLVSSLAPTHSAASIAHYATQVRVRGATPRAAAADRGADSEDAATPVSLLRAVSAGSTDHAAHERRRLLGGGSISSGPDGGGGDSGGEDGEGEGDRTKHGNAAPLAAALAARIALPMPSQQQLREQLKRFFVPALCGTAVQRAPLRARINDMYNLLVGTRWPATEVKWGSDEATLAALPSVAPGTLYLPGTLPEAPGIVQPVHVHMARAALTFFAIGDELVGLNLTAAFMEEVCWEDVLAVWTEQGSQEAAHKATYREGFNVYVGRGPESMAAALQRLSHEPAVEAKVRFAQLFMQPGWASFQERLVAFYLFEALMFMSSFAVFEYLRSLRLEDRLSGAIKSNTLISRDETHHAQFAALLYRECCVNRLPLPRLLELVRTAGEIELAFVDFLIPAGAVGFTREQMRTYIKYHTECCFLALLPLEEAAGVRARGVRVFPDSVDVLPAELAFLKEMALPRHSNIHEQEGGQAEYAADAEADMEEGADEGW